MTADHRILWGGYDAVYRYGGPVDADHDDHEPTFGKLAQHFFATFPQLSGILRSPTAGAARSTPVAASRCSSEPSSAAGWDMPLGYTGLGVGASRFGARVALDLVDGRVTEATELDYVRSRPVPFPPEPLRSAVIQLTRNRLARADESEGERGLWLRTLTASASVSRAEPRPARRSTSGLLPKRLGVVGSPPALHLFRMIGREGTHVTRSFHPRQAS